MMFPSEKLKTARLSLVPFGPNLVSQEYINWLNDQEVTRFSRQRFTEHTRDSCLEYLASFENCPSCLWAICETYKGFGHIGNISSAVDIDNNSADLGILIGNKNAWGCGYGAEAWAAVITFLFEKRGILTITAGTRADNIPMLRLATRVGMFEKNRQLRQEIATGIKVKLTFFSISAAEYAFQKKFRAKYD